MRLLFKILGQDLFRLPLIQWHLLGVAYPLAAANAVELTGLDALPRQVGLGNRNGPELDVSLHKVFVSHRKILTHLQTWPADDTVAVASLLRVSAWPLASAEAIDHLG